MYVFFFFNDTATTEIYTLSLHDALPISMLPPCSAEVAVEIAWSRGGATPKQPSIGVSGKRRWPSCGTLAGGGERKSTRLKSSHANISYAGFCFKKKKKTPQNHQSFIYTL